ncbi:MAG TPA: isochorismatase family protein [Anaerolineales bacterium]|nr:isochorismatase family protein [Anaerolineales bacterium]
MSTFDTEKKTALLVVDAQVGVLRNAWQKQERVAKLQQAVLRARSAGMPVIWVQHADSELVPGSADWQWEPPLAPAEGELHIEKQFNSSFEQTPLADALKQMGITHILLGGAATNWCIRATAYGALERGYDLTLLKDAHTTESLVFDDGTVISAENIITELNIGLQWVSYPQRTSQAVRVDDVKFE